MAMKVEAANEAAPVMASVVKVTPSMLTVPEVEAMARVVVPEWVIAAELSDRVTVPVKVGLADGALAFN
jgi:hypothetical protein